jgi:predicted nucleic acid-binding protein
MIFLDANYLLRYLVAPTTPSTAAMAESARRLFDAVESQQVEVTTSEVVLHEVAYVLASKAHYNQPVAEIVNSLTLILRMPSFRLPRGDKRRYLRALEIYASYPILGFADAVVAATVEQLGVPLASFDRGFEALSNIQIWEPSQLASL